MTNDIHLDTSIVESIDGSEIEMQLFALERSRATFAWKVGGLDADALNRAHPPSTLTLGGLVKHLARCEDERTVVDLDGWPDGVANPWDPEKFAEDPDWDFNSAAHDTPEELYALWQAAVERARAAWAKVLAGGDLGRASTRSVPGWGTPNLRRIITDMHDEYARHVGHADLLREAVDGLVGEDPPQS